MIDGAVVVDAVVHPYNLSSDNQVPENFEQLRAVHTSHVICTGRDLPEYVLDESEFLVDFDHEALTRALFTESQVDLAILHSLPNLGFTKGYITEPDRVAALRDKYPGRYLLYATVDTPTTARAIADLERQVRELAVDGLKLYPSFFYDGVAQGWRMDGADFAMPLLEAAVDLGIRNVAVHKAIPVPPAPESCFRVDDLDGALGRFPEVNFHIVHAGVAFLDETCALLSDHPNVYANLESSFSYILRKPRLFADVLAALLAAGGADRILYGSGVNLMHPRPLLEAFAAFEMPDDLPPLTAATKAAILGGNALRLHGLSADDVISKTSGDEFDVARRSGLAPPWSGVRA